MAVARSDDGTSPVLRRRTLRKASEVASPVAASTAPSSAAPPGVNPTATRLDDLYRLPMPKLFAYAEREGVAEHTGMTRGQLIMAVVRHQRPGTAHGSR